MLESYQDTIVAQLIKRGYTVGKASAGNVVINHDNQVSALLAYSLYKLTEEDIPITKVYQEVSTIITEMKGYVYSIIISESDNATWAGSNIFLHPKKDPPQLPPPISDDKKSKLN